jgi:hypothetical protein
MVGKGKSIIRYAIEVEAERRGVPIEQVQEEYLAEVRKTETPENIARAEEASKDTDATEE